MFTFFSFKLKIINEKESITCITSKLIKLADNQVWTIVFKVAASVWMCINQDTSRP